jgi:hypothetical protein
MQLVPRLIIGGSGEEDAARIADPFQPCRDVDAVAVEIVARDDHVAEIDADAENDAGVFRLIAAFLLDNLADPDGAGHRIDDAGKHHQQPVPHQLDDAAAIFLDRRLDMLAEKGLQTRQRAGLIQAHHATIPHYVGSEDSDQPPFQVMGLFHGWNYRENGGGSLCGGPLRELQSSQSK